MNADDNKNTDEYKFFGEISIPPQLANYNGARFILIDKAKGDGKKPKEKDFLTTRNYAFGDPKLMGHIKGRGNYGIATGNGWLQCFDGDEYARLKELGVIDKLPETFEVETGGISELGSVKRHLWFEIEGLQKRIVCYDPVLKDKNHPKDALHLADIQSKGQFAIGPNCIHKSGKRYRIVKDVPIAKITYEQLIEALAPLKLRKKEPRDEPTNYERKTSNVIEVPIERIGWPEGEVVKEGNGEFKGEHPFFHSSKGKRNFNINPSKGVWHCWNHDTGGGWVELLAVREGIIDCQDVKKGCLTKGQYAEVMRRAEELGLIDGDVTEAPLQEIEMENKVMVDELKPELPKDKLELWIASPRTGKSYTATELLIKTGEGNYFAPNHEIVRHVLQDATKKGIKKCVHIEGKQQPGMCRRGENEKFECKQCIMHPNQHREEGDSGETWSGLKKKAYQLMEKNTILTKEKIPIGMCPYYTLIFADEYADYCFTVINNINKPRQEGEQRRKLTVIDEDTCMNFFYPQSIELAKITRSHGKIHITTPLDNLDITTRIVELKKKENKRLTKYAKKMEEIRDALGEMDGSEIEPDEVEEKVLEMVKDWEPTKINIDDEEYGNDDDIKFGDIVKCMMYPYREMRVMMQTRGVVSKLYLMADEKNAAVNMDWFENTEKIVIIGAARAEMFVNEKGGKIKEVKKFRFEENFVLLVVDEDEKTDARGKKGRLRKKIIEIIKILSGSAEANTMRSMMVLTGSKDEQDTIEKTIGNGTFKCTSEGEQALQRVNISGLTAVFYANSKISRGLDVDQFNVMFAIGTDFAQPFMSVVDKQTAKRITVDEITNSVLRISPTRKQGSDKAKLVVVPKGEEWKIKYLGGRIMETKASAAGIARTILDMGIASESTRQEGRLTTTKNGTNKEKIYEKMFTKMVAADDYVDEGEMNVTVEMILNQLRSDSKQWYSKSEIGHKLRLAGKIFENAINLIAYSRKAQVKTGSSGTIQLKHKKRV
jgi:hypothetical protein